MTHRADYAKLAAPAYRALFGFSKSLAETTIDKNLVDLVHIRASQMNGCLFCTDMHVKEAYLHGERPLRVHHLVAFRESPLFTDKEKAALEWTELLTRPGSHGATDEDYAALMEHFDEKGVADLTMEIAAINAWNRLGIAFRTTPGSLDALLGLDRAGLGA